jgi:hypothetical protein
MSMPPRQRQRQRQRQLYYYPYHFDPDGTPRPPRCRYCGQYPTKYECAGCGAEAYTCDCEPPPPEFCDLCAEDEAEAEAEAESNCN